MNPYPQDRSVLILDNCAIHKSEVLREVIEATGKKNILLTVHYLKSLQVLCLIFCHHIHRILIQLKKVLVAVSIHNLLVWTTKSNDNCSESLDTEALASYTACRRSICCTVRSISSSHRREGKSLVPTFRI